MLKMPLEEVISKIKEKTGLSEAEIRLKIDNKLTQLSGLISKEGAATIVANELGIKLFEHNGKIKDVYPGMRNVELLGKVTNVFDVREFQRNDGSPGKVANFMIGDETGIMKIVCWGSTADIVKQLTQDTIVRLQGGFAKENQRGYKEVHLSDRSRIVLNPKGETVEIKTNGNGFSKAVRKKLTELKESDENIEVFGTIRQVYDLNFFEVCPECSQRTKQNEGLFNCSQHGNITPDYNYVLNVILDDGTDTMRLVLFRNQAEKLLQKTKQELLVYKEKPETFEEVKTALLGEQYKFVGRVKKNEFMNRIEFVTQLVFPGNPEEELEKLNEIPS